MIRGLNAHDLARNRGMNGGVKELRGGSHGGGSYGRAEEEGDGEEKAEAVRFPSDGAE